MAYYALTIDSTPPAVIPTKPITVTTMTYHEENLGISFTYPSDWIVKTATERYTLPNTTLHNVLFLQPKTVTTDSYTAAPLRIYYYTNPKKLSLEAFQTYVFPSSTPAETMWDTSFSQVTTSSGMKAYYKKNHSCVATCRLYTIPLADKVVVLLNVDATAKTDAVFHQIFTSMKAFIKNTITYKLPPHWKEYVNVNPESITISSPDAEVGDIVGGITKGVLILISKTDNNSLDEVVEKYKEHNQTQSIEDISIIDDKKVLRKLQSITSNQYQYFILDDKNVWVIDIEAIGTDKDKYTSDIEAFIKSIAIQ